MGRTTRLLCQGFCVVVSGYSVSVSSFRAVGRMVWDWEGTWVSIPANGGALEGSNSGTWEDAENRFWGATVESLLEFRGVKDLRGRAGYG